MAKMQKYGTFHKIGIFFLFKIDTKHVFISYLG